MNLVIPGTYQIWRRFADKKSDDLICVSYTYHGAVNHMRQLSTREKENGMLVSDIPGGFSSFPKNDKSWKGSFVQYWVEPVLGDNFRLDTDIIDALYVAQVTAAAEVRTKRNIRRVPR